MIVLCEDDAIAQRLRPKLEVLLDAGAELTQALPGYIEVVPTGASKATAAAALLDRWGLTWSDALAIGDGQNDVPMLREAGTSVAMANARSRACATPRSLAARRTPTTAGAVRAVVNFGFRFSRRRIAASSWRRSAPRAPRA